MYCVKSKIIAKLKEVNYWVQSISKYPPYRLLLCESIHRTTLGINIALFFVLNMKLFSLSEGEKLSRLQAVDTELLSSIKK
jgi:hypothetical protein